MIRVVVLVSFLALATAGSAPAGLTEDQRLDVAAAAQAAYAEGLEQRGQDADAAYAAFGLAVERWRQLLDDGVRNGPVLIALGNAYAQRGELGRAALAYELARRYEPRNATLLHNQSHVRAVSRNQIEAGGVRALVRAVLAGHFDVRWTTRRNVFLIVNVLLWGGLIVRRLRGWRAGRAVMIGLALIWLTLGVSVASDVVRPAAPGDVGAIVANDVIVRRAPGTGFEPELNEPLFDGVPFRVQSVRPGWVEIELENGATGWVARQQVELGDVLLR